MGDLVMGEVSSQNIIPFKQKPCLMQMNKGENLVVDLTFKFALNIIRYTEVLKSNQCFVLGDQLLRSGTSIGANVREAQNAESKRDFIHKMKIAAKEADEAEY